MNELAPVADIIRNQAYRLCFSEVFKNNPNLKAAAREEIAMEMCLMNYMKTFDAVFNFSTSFAEENPIQMKERMEK